MNQSFVHLEYSTQHPGVARLEGVVDTVRDLGKDFDSARGLTAVLLAAMVSVLIVVADQLMETWAEGHLLAAWVLLWAIGFAALALLAPAARSLAKRMIARLDAWSHRVARQRADERLWDLARKDPRVMADLNAARNRVND